MLLAFLAAAAATPVYLNCPWGAPEEGAVVQLTLDEANQRVTIARPNGSIDVLSAHFGPDEIRATERIGSETQTWVLNRLDVTVKTLVSFSSAPSEAKPCRVVSPPEKRAF